MQNSQKDLHKKLLGKHGEVEAVKYLKQKGYKILEKNYKRQTGEIDIIATINETVVFIEVKTRTSTLYGAPCEAVDKKRQTRYINTATEYLVKNGLTEKECRFDVIEILNGKINHIISAFYA